MQLKRNSFATSIVSKLRATGNLSKLTNKGAELNKSKRILPTTSKTAACESLPALLTALHIYFPESLVSTSRIVNKVPSCLMSYLLAGCMSPVLFQNTEGTGFPDATQRILTVVF